jgi:SAM-dependent methyltransferase
MKQNKYEAEYISDNWDDPAGWDGFYSEYADDDLVKNRDPKYLLRSIETFEFPTPIKILDAGSGISFMADLAVHMGHEVATVDISPVAVDICKGRRATENDLVQCLAQQYNRRFRPNSGAEYFDQRNNQIVDVQKELHSLFKPGGKFIAREVFNWNDPELIGKYGSFDIILNQNGLRNASYALIDNSFKSFFSLLKSGGLLIAINTNAIFRTETIETYAQNAGFVLLNEMKIVYSQELNRAILNPNQKYAMCCWPTG